MTEQSFTAATPDNTIFVRVALAGHTLGVQIEPAAMKRPATEIAQGIMACNDVAYLKGQLVIRAELEEEVDSCGRYADRAGPRHRRTEARRAVGR